MKFILIVAVVIACAEYGFAQEAYQTLARDNHNTYRAKHGSPPLTLDPTLNEAALKCAQYYVTTRSMQKHDCPYNKGVGENLVYGDDEFTTTDFATMGPKDWYEKEVGKYDYNAPGANSDVNGHFTQVVWKSSTKLGFAVVSTKTFTVGVGHYSPQGNVEGEYPQNVLQPQ